MALDFVINSLGLFFFFGGGGGGVSGRGGVIGFGDSYENSLGATDSTSSSSEKSLTGGDISDHELSASSTCSGLSDII